MRIWGEIPKILGIYEKNKGVGKVDKAEGVAAKKDVVSISNQAKDFQTVLKAVRETPDIRTDVVNELSEKVESGQYDVNGNDIADKVIKGLLDKRV